MFALNRRISSGINALCCRIYLRFLKTQRGVQFSSLRLRGVPIIDARNGGRIVIGENVLLNSQNIGYHVNLYGPVKLFADRPGARIEIGENTRIHGSCIHAFESVSIGRNCLIAANCQIIDANGHELSFRDVDDRLNTIDAPQPVEVMDSVWIGAQAIVLPGVRIGSGTVIGAGSVVSADIPSMVLAAGNPAQVVREYSSPPGTGPEDSRRLL
jgi:acetyltransferase-like isoleucine patch superfamily enzyme